MSQPLPVTDYNGFVARVHEGAGLQPDARDVAYEADYRSMISWFASQGQWSADSVRVGSLMVYGWMPTILRSEKTHDFVAIADAINANELDEEHWNFVNGSYVGTSKFLHFLKPKEFAIWDSRVAFALGWSGTPNSLKKFNKYQNLSRQFMMEFNQPSLRHSEQCLFWLGKRR